ncbi:hypothetical protein ACFO4N_01990 [Camelliibacillus cellulosilyticus]|uniref:Uncharacterized protein n=1 Tax=Camelliibacillus cellulosilyticus TaxID=2174486 RepID=A0ABV9GGR7_9BACL
MAFGIQKQELMRWKERVQAGDIAFITHYWFDPRFPQFQTVTKAGCADIEKLVRWGKHYRLKEQAIDRRNRFPHFDLMGAKQIEILVAEGLWDQIAQFSLAIPPLDQSYMGMDRG